MKYEVRVQNIHATDIVIKGVDEAVIGEVVTAWCGRNATVIIVPEGDAPCTP